MKQLPDLQSVGFIEHGFYNAADSQTNVNPILMNQVHSVDTLFLTGVPTTPPSVDALITQTPNLNLTVKTADCAPVLMVDTTSRMVAAVHAGWRGAFQGILESTLLEMIKHGACLNTIRAGIGPHIQQASFQAGSDMKALFPSTEDSFFKAVSDGFLFDFGAYVRYRLKRAGVLTIASVGDDTYSDSAYFSYRREPTNSGRQFSSIMIKEV